MTSPDAYLREHADTAVYPLAKGDFIGRISSKIEEDANGCWLWTGCDTGNGYGTIRTGGGGQTVAHRVVWQLCRGVVASHLQIDHLCKVRRCVNPEHLEPVTARENNVRANNLTVRWGSRTHCERGHEFTPGNTYVRQGRWRSCRECELTRRRVA